MPNPTLYSARCYDDNLVLRVPPMLWLAMIFLVRHFLFLGLSFLPRAGDAMSYLTAIVEPLFLLADALAIPVLYVAMRRKPGSPEWMRRLWRVGRSLLAGSALTYVGLWVAHFGIEQRWHFAALNESLLVSLTLDLMFLSYIATSPRVRDVFRDFPTNK